jgi:hypothetical protein
LGGWIHTKREFQYEKYNRATKMNIGELLIREKEMGYKQFADILMACRKATCVDEFKLYIAYKGSKEGSAWGKKLDERSLSDHLNDLIDGRLKKIAQEIANKEKFGSKESLEDIYLAVLDKFLGYLYWGVRVSEANGGEIKCLRV